MPIDQVLSDRIEQGVIHLVVVALGQNLLPAERRASALAAYKYFATDTVIILGLVRVPVPSTSPAVLGLRVRLDCSMNHGSRSAREPANRNVADLDGVLSIPKEDDVSPMECRRHGLGNHDHDGLRRVGQD